MALLAHNLTSSSIVLAAGNPLVTLPPSASPPLPGPAYNVTSKLTPSLEVDPVNGKTGGLSAADFAALQAQVLSGDVTYEWSVYPEYKTATLFVSSPIALQAFDNATRPAPNRVPVGTMIFNTDDGAPNWSNGADWVDSSGAVT